jgi:hypothetical protein
MKKVFPLLVVAAVFAVTMSSCASKSSGGGSFAKMDAPDWFIKPPKSENVIYGVGVAKFDTVSMSKSMAENRATVAIARKLDSDVRNMIEDTQAGVEGAKDASMNFARNVSQTLSEAKLSGVDFEDYYMAADGNIYCLASFSFARAEQLIQQAFNASKFKAAAGFNDLSQADMAAAFEKRAKNSDPY